MNKHYAIRITLIAASFFLCASAFAQTGDADARKHLVRGMAAVEMAKNEEDLLVAVEEFRKATEIAPNMAAAWYNLGSVQSKTGQFKEAIASYNRYLALAPQATDAARVNDEIIKLEFRMEQTNKVNSRGGTWVAEDGTLFRMKVLGANHLILTSDDYYVPDTEVESTYPIAGNVPVSTAVAVKYDLTLQGNKISGAWSRAGFTADKCKVPDDGAEVTGELQEANHTLILHYAFTKFSAHTFMSLLSDDYCGSVETVAKKETEKKFFGPLPKGGLGITLGGVHAYWAGGFSSVKYGWTGHLVVGQLESSSPAYAAGLRLKDEILTIDGATVASLSGSDAIRKLRGEPGTEIVLTVSRKKASDPVTITLRRVEIPDNQWGLH